MGGSYTLLGPLPRLTMSARRIAHSGLSTLAGCSIKQLQHVDSCRGPRVETGLPPMAQPYAGYLGTKKYKK